MKFNIPRINIRSLPAVKSFVRRNAPTILTGVGVAGVVATAVMTAKATYNATETIFTRESITPGLTKGEKFKLVWKDFVPAAITGFISCAAIVGAHGIHVKQHAALATAYAAAEAGAIKYQDKIKEILGDNEARKAEEAVVADKIKENPPKEIIVTGRGDQLCYDDFSGRYFRSSREKIDRAVNSMNQAILHDWAGSINELYERMGLRSIGVGDQFGWNPDRLIEVEYSSALNDDGDPCLAVVLHPFVNYTHHH